MSRMFATLGVSSSPGCRRPRRRARRTTTVSTGGFVLATWLAALVTAPAPAGAQIPDTFTNLRYFPDDISRDSLIAVMRRFSFALNVPCRYCHAGGPEDSPFALTDVDFASDEKLEKRTARYMLRIVDEINGELLAGLPTGPERAGVSRVRLECRTCHRGLPRPEMIDRIIGGLIANEGVDAAVAHYRELRELYYGDWRYDFDSRVMIELASELAAADQVADGIVILTMMTEYDPESVQVWLPLGDLQRMAGRRDEAVESYRRVLRISPDHAAALQRLREIGGTEPRTSVPSGE